MRLRLAPSMKGVTLKHISAIADTMKLAARGVKVPLEGMGQLKLPAILHWDMNHFVVLTKISGDSITVSDPARGRRVLTAQGSLGPLHRRGDGTDAHRRLRRARRAREDQCVAAGEDRHRPAQRRHPGAAAFARARSAGDRLAVLPAARRRPCRRRARPRPAGRTRHRLRAAGDNDRGDHRPAVVGLGVYISTRLNLQLLDTLFARLLRLPLAWFEKRHIGDIVSRFRSVDAIQRTLSLTFLETIMDGVMVLVTLAVMLWYSRSSPHRRHRGAALRRTAMGDVRAAAARDRRAHRSRGEGRDAFHRNAARDDGDQAQPARNRTPRRLPVNHVVDQTNADVRVQNLALRSEPATC